VTVTSKKPGRSGGRDEDPDALTPAPRGRGRPTDRQLKEQLDQYLVRRGRSIDGLVAALLRRLHDAAAFEQFCRALTSGYGANILQVVMAEALKQIGREGYSPPASTEGK
jgi:hypothetical protein